MPSVDDFLFNPSRDLCNNTIFADNAVMNIEHGSSSGLNAAVLGDELAAAGLGTDLGEDDAMMWDMLIGPALGEVEDSGTYSVSGETDHENASSLLTCSTALSPRLDNPTVLESEMTELGEENYEGAGDVGSSMSAVLLASNAARTNAVDIFATHFTVSLPMELVVAPGSNDTANLHPKLLVGTNDTASLEWFQGALDGSGVTFDGLDMETTGAVTLPSTPTSSVPSGSYESFTSGGPCSSIRKGSTKKIPCPNGCGREVGGQEWHLQRHIQSGKCAAGCSLSRQRSKENRPPVCQRKDTLFPSTPIPLTLANEWSASSKRPDIGCNPAVDPAVQYDLDGFRGPGCPGVKVNWAAGNIFSTFP